MKSLLLTIVFTVLSAQCLASSAERPTATVDGKSYPVYAYVTEARPTKRANPIYPAKAKSEGRGGMISVGALIDEKGKVTSTFVKSSDAGADLQEAARNAVAKWRFTPIKEGGSAIAFVVYVSVLMRPE